jgi:DNA-binding MarR family transcriptional regulator
LKANKLNTKAKTLSSRPGKDPGEELEAAVQEFATHFGRTTVSFKKLFQRPPAAMEALIASKALGPRHVPAMVRLASEGPLSVGELAERLGLSLPTASLLVGDLSRHGLVDRREDERDRRRTIVTVSDRYREDMVAAYAVRFAPVRRALERMSPAQRAAFIKALRAVGDEYEREAATVADADAG